MSILFNNESTGTILGTHTMPPKMTKKAALAAANAIGDKYKKLDHREHVLSRPGMYIGSVEEDVYNTWVFEDGRMVKRDVRFVPGLYKIFDEILVNAVDHCIRLRGDADAVNKTKNIRINISQDTGILEIQNDGDGIEVELHPEHGVYVPELIFGHLLTSTNYDDATNQDRIIGGQNGIGAKACNIFSKRFVLETVDAKRKKIYTQEFSDNMNVIGKPTIKACAKKPYTRIEFLPDYERFKLKGLTQDMFALLVKRTYDVCAVTPNDVNVFLNGEKLDYKSFEKYADLYLGAKSDHDRVYEKVNDRLEVIASYHEHDVSAGLEQVSFVNGIWTFRGGKHVDAVAQSIGTKLCEQISKRKKDVDIKPQHVKNYLFVFVKATIPSPTFDSQSKDILTTPASKFGFKVELSDKFIDKLSKSGIMERALAMSELNASKNAKKTDGKKSNTIRGITKLDDANWAGTAKSAECTLILTEGDSAKSMAIAGLAEVGRDRFGVFPLKGKLLNVKDIGVKKIMENDEITHLKKILGLEANKDYTNVQDLRYGKVLVMTDQDVDGSHIKGLLFNLFHTLWPSLIKMENFMTSMLTPIVKAKRGTEVISFYSLSDFERWQNDAVGKWEIKYYKGLGTSTAAEARQYFKDLKMVKYVWDKDTSDEALDLAFNKKRADDRKQWLGTYDRADTLDFSKREVTYDEFVQKDLIHFSNYDLERSIPSMCDGFKVSQRKVLFACFKRNLTKQEIRVAQLAAYVSEHSAYHHGEASLQSTIIGLAQDFVGSNNINLLKPNGQFGTRIQGGKDAASPRYIHTVMNEITPFIFTKEDAPLLEYIEDDGVSIEPTYYMPIIPTVLVNGALGIGTGFSTNIPSYNPRDLIACIRKLLVQGMVAELPSLTPWYRGFKGTIEDRGDGKFISRGCFKRISPTQVEVTELPVGVWTEDFKEMLEGMLDKEKGDKYLKSYESAYTDSQVRFKLIFANKAALDDLLVMDTQTRMTKLETEFKLWSSKLLGTTNMYLFNNDQQIRKYDTVHDIIRDYYQVRLGYYHKRKIYWVGQLRQELDILSAKVRFINGVIAGTLHVMNRSRADIVSQLEEQQFYKVEDSYDYLLRLPIYQLTQERKIELEKNEADKRAELAELEKTTAESMWSKDLDAFEANM